MRAWPGIPCPLALVNAGLLCFAVILVQCQEDDRGYYAEEPFEEAIDVTEVDPFCPTDRPLRTRATCHVDGANIQCIRLRCCDTHVFISGRCIPKTVDPCSLQLCEQACRVTEGRIWCSCHHGYQFDLDNYRRKSQPFCVDINECNKNNGGCQERCINDPGSYHCECSDPLVLARDGKRCEPPVVAIPIPLALPAKEPLALTRAASRCFAPCDSVSWLSKKVHLLSNQLRSTQAALNRLLQHPVLNPDAEQFAEGNFPYRVLDSTAPLEGGYCRCERGPRGPPGAPGMEGPKGDQGERGPRGPRGRRGSLDLMLLLLADLRHDVKNLENKVYQKGEIPERFDLEKALRKQRKQESLEQESRVQQELEAYTVATTIDGPVDIRPNGQNGQITHEDQTTTDWSLIKGDTDPPEEFSPYQSSSLEEEQMRFLRLLASSTAENDDLQKESGDYDYGLD